MHVHSFSREEKGVIQEKENGRRRGEGQGALQGAGQEQKLHASCQEGERASAQKLWTPAYNTVYPPTEAVLSGQGDSQQRRIGSVLPCPWARYLIYPPGLLGLGWLSYALDGLG